MGDHVESKDAVADDIPNWHGNNFKLIINKEGKEIVCWHKRICVAE